MPKLTYNDPHQCQFLELFSRKNSPENQLYDVMARLLEQSDPKIVGWYHLMKPIKICTRCGSTKHTLRSHKQKHDVNMTVYDNIVKEMFLNDDSSMNVWTLRYHIIVKVVTCI